MSSQDWPGEAAVDVSIVNWIKGDDARRPVLDGEEVERIGASLRADQGHAAKKLPPNRGIAFQGMLPGANYIVGLEAAGQLRSVASPAYGDVVRPYLTGDDIANHPAQAPSRFIIDFGTRRLEEAMCYPEAVEIVRAQAKDDREQSRSYSRNPRWWQFLWPRPVFRERTKTLRRFIAGTATGKRILFCWCASDVVASNATNVFALEEDSDFGILMSRIHTGWAEARSSTLEDRIRYTPSSAFETFPWPTSNGQSIGDVAGRLLALRAEICGAQEIGLTTLYNQMDDGAWTDLRDLHRELDEAVAAAYGWPKSVAHDPDESNRRLLELNRAIAAGEVEYDPFRER